MQVVVTGPRGCGKTRNADRIAAHYGKTVVVDGWDGRSRLPANALALTNVPAASLRHSNVVEFAALKQRLKLR